MPTDTQFATDWLEERQRFDKAARNPTVEAAFLRYAAPFEPINLIDIGSGSGAVFTYLSPKLPPEQNWTLVELNPKLLKSARARLLLWANGNGYTIEKEENDYLLFTGNERRLSIQLRQESFLKLDKILPLDAYHAVTASAVIDLLSRDMLKDLLQLFQQHDLAFYATLNYSNMYYQPEDDEDETVIEAYERHMQRVQDFGSALGADCSAALQELCNSVYGNSPETGPSPWTIQPMDAEIHRHMLSFIRKSVPEVDPNIDIEAWVSRKELLMEGNQLHLTVEHNDHFIAPTDA